MIITVSQNFVHGRSVFLADGFSDIENLCARHVLPHGYFDYIADLDVIGRAGNLAVDGDMLCVADLIGHRAALYKS